MPLPHRLECARAEPQIAEIVTVCRCEWNTSGIRDHRQKTTRGLNATLTASSKLSLRMPFPAWCCGTSKPHDESEEETATPVNDNRRRSSVKRQHSERQHNSEKYSIDERSVSKNSTMKLVTVGSSSPSAFTEGGMNFAVERDSTRIWSSPQGVSIVLNNHHVETCSSSDQLSIASNCKARWHACIT